MGGGGIREHKPQASALQCLFPPAKTEPSSAVWVDADRMERILEVQLAHEVTLLEKIDGMMG